jgi:hypothetical protein
MRADERVELPDDVTVSAELEIRLDPLLDGDHAQLLEPAGLGLRELLEREVGESRATPERQGLLEQLAPIAGRSAASGAKELLEAVRIDPLRIDPEEVTGSARLENVLAQLSPQARDRVLKGRRRRSRSVLPVQEVDQPVGRYDATGLEQENCEKGALPVAAECERASLGFDLERAQDPEVERHS